MQEKGLRMEILFSWAMLYSNSKSLTVPVLPQMAKFNKIQKEINKLKENFID